MKKIIILAGTCAIWTITAVAAAPGPNEHSKSSGASDKVHGAERQVDHGRQSAHEKGSPKSERQEARNEHQSGKRPERSKQEEPVRDQKVHATGNNRQEAKAADRRPQPSAPHTMVRTDVGERHAQPVRKWSRPEDARRFYATFDHERNRGPANFCPPGLARKNNSCLPPGQARKLYQRDDRWGRYMAYEPRYRGGDWSYYNGYAYSRSHETSFIPLIGGALFIGQRWPGDYDRYEVPVYYSNYYGYHRDYRYYYTDRTIFGVDRNTLAIMGIAALLTGNDFIIGQRMPMGYDVYNVPYAYRDRYYDSDEAHYRYSDGYIYRIDPRTRNVVVAIELNL